MLLGLCLIVVSVSSLSKISEISNNLLLFPSSIKALVMLHLFMSLPFTWNSLPPSVPLIWAHKLIPSKCQLSNWCRDVPIMSKPNVNQSQLGFLILLFKLSGIVCHWAARQLAGICHRIVVIVTFFSCVGYRQQPAVSLPALTHPSEFSLRRLWVRGAVLSERYVHILHSKCLYGGRFTMTLCKLWLYCM